MFETVRLVIIHLLSNRNLRKSDNTSAVVIGRGLEKVDRSDFKI